MKILTDTNVGLVLFGLCQIVLAIMLLFSTSVDAHIIFAVSMLSMVGVACIIAAIKDINKKKC